MLIAKSDSRSFPQYSISWLDPSQANPTKEEPTKGPILQNPVNLDLGDSTCVCSNEEPRNLIIPIEMLPNNRPTPKSDDTGR